MTDKEPVTVTLAMQIVKGLVADYARSIAWHNSISHSGLARILREIAEELDK